MNNTANKLTVRTTRYSTHVHTDSWSHDSTQPERHTMENLAVQKRPQQTRRTTNYNKFYETKWI
jgi:hypothetical protein